MFTEVRTGDTSGGSAPAPEPDALQRGTLAGPWRIEHELGRGGMGTVYAVTHEDIGKRAALKVVHAHAITPWFTSERFLLEARVVNQVAHPGIVDIFETGVLGDGRPYLVMERLAGTTLGQRLGSGRILADEVCAIMLEVCDAIRAAHAADIVHRDLKLDNIFLLTGSEPAKPIVKVLDWGIAKILTGDPTNTFADRLIGTPRYVSPEQARGGEVTTKADIYSLGIMAYELFLESPPFLADSAAELLVMHLRDLPPPPHELWPDIPEELETLLLDMLAKEAVDRPTIEEVARRLSAARNTLCLRRIVFEPTSPDPVRHLPRAPRRRPLPAPRRAGGVITSPMSSSRSHLVRALAVVALLGGVAMSARVLTADDNADAEVAHAPARIATPPSPHVDAIRITSRVATASSLDATAPAEKIAPAPHRAAAAPRHPATPREVAAAPALLETPSPVRIDLGVLAVPHLSSVHRPRRVALAVDPDGTIEPYR